MVIGPAGCAQMYTLARRGSGGGVWREISDYNQQLADEGQDDNSAVMSVSRMGLVKILD